MKFNKARLKEDLRKLGVGLALAGVIGFILPGDKVGFLDGLALVVVGLKLWGFGLLEDKQEDKE